MTERPPLDSFPESMTVPEAARVLGISERNAYAAAKAGQLPILRFGSRIVVPREALRRHMAEAVPDAAPVPARLLRFDEVRR